MPKWNLHSGVIHTVAARATPLWERAGLAGLPAEGYDPRVARERRRHWRRILGGSELLRRRLRATGLAPGQMERLLGGASGHGEPPSWAQLLARWLDALAASSGPSPSADRTLAADAPLPFEEILLPLLRLARADAAARAGAAVTVLGERAARDLERQLLAHLAFVGSLAFGQDFLEFRFRQAPVSALGDVWSRRPRSTEIYDGYVQHLQDGGLRQLLERFPVLARLLCQSAEQWIAATADLCRRFAADFPVLVATFDIAALEPAAALAAIRTDLSDRHRGGLSVCECVLSSGERLMYKPRTVRPEASFYGFVGRLNRLGLPLDLKVVRSLDCGSHGWVEHVPAFACSSAAEVADYYARAGMLLAVLHLLAVTDVHCENLIAHGSQPVVVDLETLLSERPPARRRETGDGNSILRTGLLPQWETAPDGKRYDLSALGADDGQDPGLRHSTWRNVNTDQMALVQEAGGAAAGGYRVRLGDESPTVAAYLPQFVAGFKAAYCALLANRAALLADREVTAAFENLELRVLVRNTDTYTRLQLHLLHPDYLRDGIDRSLELEWLARPLCATVRPRRGRVQVYEGERRAMEALDIPHFGTGGWRELEIADDDEDFRLLCGERNSAVLRRRLQNLSDADCARQVAVIQESIASRFAVG
ncbi:MAG: type 2 lanthipeptide synthetase LanM [Dongiaceae bacterium]